MTVLADLLEDADIHAVYLERLRAERLAKTMWQLTQEHITWRVVSTSAPLEARGGMGGGDGSGSASVGMGSTVAYLEFIVPPVRELAFEGEQWRIWQARYVEAYTGLPLEQQEEWREHLLRNRYSAVFATLPRCQSVRRAVSASRNLADAALKILVYCERNRKGIRMNDKTIRAKIAEVEREYGDVLNLSAAEISNHEHTVYWTSKRARALGLLDAYHAVLGETTDNDKYPALRDWKEAAAEAGQWPWRSGGE